MTSAPVEPRPYADAVVAYSQAGWPCVLPVPPASKFPPPEGYTGADGHDTDPLTLVEFATKRPADSIALRMPEGVIGIDVDQYLKGGKQKNGAATVAAAVEKWGPLPPTWASTARGGGPNGELGPGESRVLLFRVPPRRYAAQLGPDVEVIQRHHRYSVVWPSTNPETGTLYRWYRPDGAPATPGEVPSPMDLAELPAAWVAGLAEGATEQGPASADPASGGAMLAQLMADMRPECAEVTSARLTALSELTAAEAGSRHDACSSRIYQLVQLGAAGHTGTAYAIEQLREAWAMATAGEAREREFVDMLTTAARKAVTLVGEHPVPRDPCVFAEGFEVPSAAPADLVDEQTGQPIAPIEPPRWWLPREIIGTHAFDPRAELDQPLAQAVLERTYPLLRYAFDSRGWLMRVRDRWELHDDLADRGVTLVASLLPVGDPTAEKGSDEEARSKRRARFNTHAGARAIAGRMNALVKGGVHPSAIKLADLDADPEVLWAGGLPWNLRACQVDDPMERWVAHLDPATPHLQTAAVMPELRETPLWDAFTAAVWPDPAVRAWAIRVLAVTLTGRSDRSLPILIGEQGRGKTQVISLLMSVLGSYAHAADRRLLNAEGARAHQSIVYALKGRRLSFIDEGTKGGQFAEAQLKLLTGGGELTGNQMGQNPISFQPTHTLVLTTNPEDEPVLVDPAIRARVRLIPCDGDPDQVRLARAAIGGLASQAWRAEAAGVLAKMMLEAGAWLGEPMTGSNEAAPEGVQQLAASLAHGQDPIKGWLEDEAEPWPTGTPSRELYQSFVASCTQANMRRDTIPSETAWGRALNREGYPAIHTNQGKRRLLRIRPQGPWVPSGDGFTPKSDGLVTGSTPNPSPAFSQVNPSVSVEGDGLTGFIRPTHVHTPAPAPAHEAGTQKEPNPSPTDSNSQPDLHEQPVTGSAGNPSSADPTPDKAAAAREKRAAVAEERRLAAIAAAAGADVELPAMVLRDGSVRTAELADAVALLSTLEELTVDVEHTGYPVGHRDYALKTVQLGDERFTIVLDPHEPGQAAAIRQVVAGARILHAHSATADLVPLEVAGLLEHGYEEAWSRMHDTVIPAKLADPASTGSDPGLKKLAEAMLGEQAVAPRAEEARSALFKAGKWLTEVKPTTPIERSGWAQVNPRSETMIRYAASDVLDDAAIARVLPAPPPAVLERELMAQRMTARVALHGLRLDGERVRQLRDEQQTALAAAAGRLGAFGIENPGSDQQVATAVERLGLVLPRTKTGRPSVASGVLEPHKDAEGPLGELIGARLAYQEAENRLGLFLDGYHLAVTQGDGRVRPTVYTMEAKTGRMSCVRPNLQQVPRSGGYRSCITADPGEVLISADFSSVELRVAAALSQDQAMIRMLADGVDYHQMIARIVWGPNAGKAERYKAKPMVFGRIYGSGAPGMARQNGVSEVTARAVIDAMDQLTPGLTGWSRSVADGVEAGRTQFPTHSGRIVHMPRDRSYAAPNYCIQGTARELLIDALVRWEQTRWGSNVLLPVHDELVVRVPEDEAEQATAALTECMTTELYGIPIVAEASEPSFAWRDSA